MIPGYPFKLASGSIWKEKWINLLSVLTISAGLFIVAVGFFAVYNMNLVTRKLPERFSITLFLKNGTSGENTNKIMKALKGYKSIESIRYTSSADALKELKETLKDADYILEGLGENPLPPSIDIRLKKEFVKTSSVKELAGKLRVMEGVEDVQFAEKFLSSINAIVSASRRAGLALLSALSLGIIFVCYSTVKILFYRKNEEIETLKLLGATKWFIRAPFLIEGGVIGLAGGLLASGGTWAFYWLVYQRLSELLPVLRLLVLPNAALIALPVAGLFIGVTGAALALGRVKF
jgi:cell division transport system permease protein